MLSTRPLVCSHGLALQNGYLDLVESGLPGVSRPALERGELEIVVELPRTATDGIAFDREGGLRIGCYQPNHPCCVAPDGAVDCVVDDWTGEFVHSPTNLAFAGPAPGVLMLASL